MGRCFRFHPSRPSRFWADLYEELKPICLILPQLCGVCITFDWLTNSSQTSCTVVCTPWTFKWPIWCECTIKTGVLVLTNHRIPVSGWRYVKCNFYSIILHYVIKYLIIKGLGDSNLGSVAISRLGKSFLCWREIADKLCQMVASIPATGRIVYRNRRISCPSRQATSGKLLLYTYLLNALMLSYLPVIKQFES